MLAFCQLWKGFIFIKKKNWQKLAHILAKSFKIVFIFQCVFDTETEKRFAKCIGVVCNLGFSPTMENMQARYQLIIYSKCEIIYVL